jgi:hypothetical protein
MLPTRSWLEFGLLLAIAAALVLASQPAQAHTAPAGSFAIVVLADNDRAYNWDFNDDDHDPAPANVDMPVDMVFHNNANINKVKDQVLDYDHCGQAKYARLKDGTSWVWDGDGGVKDDCGGGDQCADGLSYHLRVYADSDDRMYNTNYGYYILGAAHMDNYNYCGDPWHPICCDWIWSGYNNDAEAWFAQRSQGRGYTVLANWGNWYNAATVYDSEHPIRNNGKATYVNVP